MISIFERLPRDFECVIGKKISRCDRSIDTSCTHQNLFQRQSYLRLLYGEFRKFTLLVMYVLTVKKFKKLMLEEQTQI